MNNDDFNQIEDLKIQIATLQQENQEIKSLLNKEYSHRISFLTWSLANPVALVIYPTLSTIFIQLVIINWGTSSPEDISLRSLTNGVNWTIPLTIFLVGIYLSFANKIYLIIQENADMNIFKMLETSINGQSQRLAIAQEKREAEYKAEQAKKEAEYKAEQAKKDAEYKAEQAKKEAEYKADKEKRDKEIKDLISELQSIKLSQARIETKQEQR